MQKQNIISNQIFCYIKNIFLNWPNSSYFRLFSLEMQGFRA